MSLKTQFHKEEAKIVQLRKDMHQKFPAAAQIALISEVQELSQHVQLTKLS